MKEIKAIMIGNVLKLIRKDRGLSQEEIAGRTGLDRTYISMLERNIKQPSITTIFLLAEALDIKPSEFVAELEKEYRNYLIKRDTY
ncbi:helix-turn-helix domain-containing protein [Niallia circulans]|uniref:helix-turn-helix domain-containing protein n=1 Tax=Niallia circulans TaxID=1397 RepID=UPI00201E61BC|nr:helix-turn-helix transcriptional regulator [Niallia circulans]